MATYGTFENNIMRPAPKAIQIGGDMICLPGSADIARLNAEREKESKPPYLEEVDVPPQTDAAHYAVATGWERDGDTWRRVYEVREVPPPPPRTFDKYQLVDALMKRGVWDYVKEWLQSVPNAYDRAVMAPDISEDEPLLADGIAAIKQLLGWSDADVEEVLQEAAI